MHLIRLILLAILPATTIAQQTPSFSKAIVVDYLQQQQYDEAILYINNTTTTKDPTTLSLLGYTYNLSGKPDQAAAAYNQWLQIDSSAILPHLQLATIYIQQDKPALAIPHYRQLISLQPDKAIHYRQLAFAYSNTRQHDTAFVYLSKAYTLNPSDPKVVSRLGEEWVERKQYTTADSILLPYLSKDSMNAFVLIPAIRSAYFQKHYLRTIQLGQRLMEQNLTAPSAMMYVAAACFNSARFDECIRVNEYMTSRQAALEGIIYYAALAHNRLKNYDQSNQLLLLCINMAKSKSLEEYYAAMAGNYELLKQYKQAAANYDTSFFLSHEPLRQYSLGRMYESRLQNKTIANKYYKKYLRLAKPKDEEEQAIYKYVQAVAGQ
ncbi:hypothetical protein KTO58_22895 [Chitinophaga pendula]|uniref:tetratricopeptide repeat protein n=1 Tax=Chitinophaga TaxID=79328 RepID=UPI000BB09AF1|nr:MULTISPECIES: hypothetical protein [Chitinophaga]ASZ10538.1 hypothetical protein CK934_05880 [Chitinophaga sp. MD30]UCJ06489.1 hypothetical protein KTO58_22895 [Chitinophaga pendula]